MRRHLIVLGVAVLAGALAAPGAAAAVPPGAEVHLAALTEPGSVPISPGRSAPVTVGVADISDRALNGAVLNVNVRDDVKLPHTFGNCWYYEGRDYSGAWCAFDQTLQPGIGYATTLAVSAIADARPDKVGNLSFGWYPPGYGSDDGGLQGLARAASPIVATPEKGSSGAATLTATSKLTVQNNPPTGTVGLRLVEASSTPASAPATTTAPAAAAGTTGASTTPPPADGSSGGGLPITGSNSAIYAGGGLVLTLAGLVGLVVTRRRRTRFVA